MSPPKLGKRRARKPGFAGYVAMLAGSNAFASLFTIAIVPVITRLFEPEAFGVAALFVSLATLVGSVFPLRYERAAVLPDDRSEARHLALLAIVSSFTFAAVFQLLVALCLFTDLGFPYSEKLGVWLWLLPVMALVNGLNLVLEMWLIRSKSFRNVALTSVADPVINGSVRMGLGFLYGSSIWGLIVGGALGWLAKFSVMVRACWRDLWEGWVHRQWDQIRLLAIRYKDFPKYNAPSGFVNRLATDLPLLLFGYLYSPEIVGFYAISMRLLQAPIQICSNAVRKVYHPNAAERINAAKRLLPSLLKIIGLCAVAGVVPFGILWAFGDDIVAWLLSEKWRVAGEYSQILVPWLFFMWVSMPCAVVVEVLRKQSIWLYVQISHVLTRGMVFVWAYYYGVSPADTLQVFVIVCVLGNVGVLALGIYFTRQYDQNLTVVNKNG